MSRNKSFHIKIMLGCGLSIAALHVNAATTQENKLNAIVPVFKPKLEFNFALSALKPSASNISYVIYNKGLPLQSPSWKEEDLRPKYSFAFEMGTRYLFTEKNDVQLNWVHLNSNTSSSVRAPNDNFFLGPDYEIGPDAIPIRMATGNVQFKYDVINLDIGHSIILDNHLGIRLFGGLSNGYLREQIKAIYAGNVTTGLYPGPFSTQQKVMSNFAGIGPRFGMEANYQADSGFGFFGEAAASALIGSISSKTSYISASQQLLATYGQIFNYQTIQDLNFTQVIPGFDTKLGLSYSRTFKNDMKWKVEGGYAAAVYLNAINQYLPGTLVSGQSMTTGGIFVATMSHTQSNYSVQGPFLNVILEC